MVDPISLALIGGAIVGGVKALFAPNGKKLSAFVDGAVQGTTTTLRMENAYQQYSETHSRHSLTSSDD